MTELFACFAIGWLGICGHIEAQHFATEGQCREALAQVLKSKAVDHAYCHPPGKGSAHE